MEIKNYRDGKKSPETRNFVNTASSRTEQASEVTIKSAL